MWGISELSENAYLVMKDPAPCRINVTVIFLYSLLDSPGGPRPSLWGSWITFKPHLVRFLWTSDQLVAETSIWQHTTLTTDKHTLPLRVANPHSQQASSLDPTPLTATTLEPEPTQQSKPTFVWAFIARHVWLLLIRHVCPDF